MEKAEFIYEVRQVVMAWLNSRENLDREMNESGFPWLYEEGWGEGVERNREFLGKTREDYLAHIRVYMLFGN
jgi:hypothetical protein